MQIQSKNSEKDILDEQRRVSKQVLNPFLPFKQHINAFQTVFKNQTPNKLRPIYIPSKQQIEQTNIYKIMKDLKFSTYSQFLKWSQTDSENFQRYMDEKHIKINYTEGQKPTRYISYGPSNSIPKYSFSYLHSAKFNIVDSCFKHSLTDNQTAIIYQPSTEPNSDIKTMSYTELYQLVCKVANSLSSLGYKVGDRIAIDTVMTAESVAIYLGIIKAGMVVVSIADSFSAKEICLRLKLSKTKLIFTQDIISRLNKEIPLYERVLKAISLYESEEKNMNIQCVVFPFHSSSENLFGPAILRKNDILQNDFLNLSHLKSSHKSIICHSDSIINILFSSGTTAEPKTIPWTHSSPFKTAVDGYLHQDIKPHEVIAQPTNLGQMMGPQLIFAALLNRASIALFYGSPNQREFCEFVGRARVNMLGVIPSTVKSWRSSDQQTPSSKPSLDQSSVSRFSSTGEASNSIDYHQLVSRANYAPVIEYCGGTEISGGYVSGTMVQPQVLSAFSTPCLGSDFLLLDADKKPSLNGEVALLLPSIGYSNKLLNGCHFRAYYKNMPQYKLDDKEGSIVILRRHGDHLRCVKSVKGDENDYQISLGRIDDTMNIGGIKIGSIELEKVCLLSPYVSQAACGAVRISSKSGFSSTQGFTTGPSRLVVFIVLSDQSNWPTKPASNHMSPSSAYHLSRQVTTALPTIESLKRQLQKLINQHLNPLFRIFDVVIYNKFPMTASGKVMRRILRDEYQKKTFDTLPKPVSKL